jgi:2-keto-4-pentenoate hydratase
MNDRMNRAARSILEVRRSGVLIDALPASAQLQSMEEGYAVQRSLIAQWPDRIAGWKAGATSKEVQALFGISEPIYGPVFQSQVFQSPATIPARHFHHRLLESEFVFRFGKDMPSRPIRYTRSEILDAVDAPLAMSEKCQ